jgi:Nif-specific regulatory protein
VQQPLPSCPATAAPTPDLFENELFGHHDGAYTGEGAAQEGSRPKRREARNFSTRSTRCRSPARSSCYASSSKKEYRRLGDSRIRKVDIRFVAATKVDLPALIEACQSACKSNLPLIGVQFCMPNDKLAKPLSRFREIRTQ